MTGLPWPAAFDCHPERLSHQFRRWFLDLPIDIEVFPSAATDHMGTSNKAGKTISRADLGTFRRLVTSRQRLQVQASL